MQIISFRNHSINDKYLLNILFIKYKFLVLFEIVNILFVIFFTPDLFVYRTGQSILSDAAFNTKLRLYIF